MTLMPDYEITHSGTRDGTFKALTLIDDPVTIEIFEKLKAKANTFSFKVANIRRSNGPYKYADIFEPIDQISIKLSQGMVSGNVPVGTNLVMVGNVKSFDYDESDNGSFLIVKGDDLISKLLEVVHVANYTTTDNAGAGWTSSTLLVNMMNKLNFKLPLDQQFQFDIQTTTTKIGEDIASQNKKVRDIIDLISIDKHTGNGNYTFWLDSSTTPRTFRWKKKPTVVDRQIDAENEVYSFQPRKSVFNVKNFLYVDCGTDLNNNTIWTYSANFPSIAEVGWKEDVWAKPSIAEDLKSNGLTGQTLINAAKEIGRSEGDKELITRSHPSWQVAIELPGTSEYNIANFVYVTSSGLGGDWTAKSTEYNPAGSDFYYGKQLRVNGVTQRLSQEGYVTELDLLEELETTI